MRQKEGFWKFKQFKSLAVPTRLAHNLLNAGLIFVMTVPADRPASSPTPPSPSREERKAPGISLSSVLEPEYLQDLESLLFFNPLQRTVESGIVKSLENFGMPEVLVQNDRVRIQVRELPGLQTLYAFERERGEKSALIGALLYCRSDETTITVPHIAVRKDYCVRRMVGRRLLRRLLGEARRVARLIHGVDSITITYTNRKIRI